MRTRWEDSIPLDTVPRWGARLEDGTWSKPPVSPSPPPPSECGYTAGGDYDALALMATWPVEKYAARHGVDVVKAWEWLLDLYVIIGLDFSGG